MGEAFLYVTQRGKTNRQSISITKGQAKWAKHDYKGTGQMGGAFLLHRGKPNAFQQWNPYMWTF